MVTPALAQLGQFGAFGDIPVEITADGETRFEGGVAIAEDNVQIHYGDVSIFADYAEYNPDTRDVLLRDNVRIYTPDNVFTSERALYNLETKQLRSLQLSGEQFPLKFEAQSVRAPTLNEFRVRNGLFTTQDSSMPWWKLRSRSVRIYPDDRVILSRTTLYLGEVPIFWFPYLFAELDETGFEFVPGYDSRWGAYLLTSYSFPIGSGRNVIGRVHFDLRSELGVGVGADLEFDYGPNNRNTGDFLSYYAYDTDPDDRVGGFGEPAETGDPNRWRISFQHRLFLTDDIYALADINALSDQDILEDYFPDVFRTDPRPDNFLSLTKWNEFYTMNLVARWQINDFQEYTERLPEFAWDFKQHRLFGTPVYYDGTHSIGYLQRAFSDLSPRFDANYAATRFDTFNQLTVPFRLFKVLSIVPKFGYRGTYYSQSGNTFFSPTNFRFQTSQDGSLTRSVVNSGIEASFKFSKTFERAQNRWLGLDGLKHVVQPYTNYSYAYNSLSDAEVARTYLFDRYVPSTAPQPLDFPQFYAVDSIQTWSIWRLGVRNRLLTRRDNGTFPWMTLDTFFDVNGENPYVEGDLSNVYNRFTLNPVPWFSLISDFQLPLVDEGFTQADTSFRFQPFRNFLFSFNHRYIQDAPFFRDSSQLTFFAYWHINQNWAVSFRERYEFVQEEFLGQEYTIHRDLSSWVASLSAVVRPAENSSGNDEQEFGIVFTVTLKDAPQVSLPFEFAGGQDGFGEDSGN